MVDVPIRVVAVVIVEAEAVSAVPTAAIAAIVLAAAGTLVHRQAATATATPEVTAIMAIAEGRAAVAAVTGLDSNIVHRPIDFHAKTTIGIVGYVALFFNPPKSIGIHEFSSICRTIRETGVIRRAENGHGTM